MEKQAVKDDFIVTVAEKIRCNPDHLRLAGYGQDQLERIFNRAARAERVAKYLTVSGGLVLIGALGLGLFVQDEDWKARLGWPVIPAAIAVFAGNQIGARRDGLRKQAEYDALAAGLRSFKNQPPPQP